MRQNFQVRLQNCRQGKIGSVCPKLKKQYWNRSGKVHRLYRSALPHGKPSLLSLSSSQTCRCLEWKSGQGIFLQNNFRPHPCREREVCRKFHPPVSCLAWLQNLNLHQPRLDFFCPPCNSWIHILDVTWRQQVQSAVHCCHKPACGKLPQILRRLCICLQNQYCSSFVHHPS